MSTYVPQVIIDKPNRSNFNLSRTNRFDCAPGILYPVFVQDVYPSDDIDLDLSAIIKTMPTIGPLFGSFKVQFDAYFVPTRLYVNVLHNNETDFDPYNVHLPVVRVAQMAAGSIPNQFTEDYACNPSSIFHFLGVPSQIGAPDSDTGPHVRNFNGCTYLGYWDIFKNYYANLQEENAYVMGSNTPASLIGSHPFPQAFPLANLDLKRKAILAHDATVSSYLVNQAGSYMPYKMRAGGSTSYSSPFDYHIPKGGLALRTFLPDRFTIWLDSDKYEATLSKALVDVTSGAFNMDQLRFANKLNEMLQKTLVAGGRYSDWQYVQYGSSARPLLESPIFIGSRSTELTFEDVVQSSSSPQAGSADYDPSSPYGLGSLGGLGKGFLSGRKMSYYCNELGYIMVIMSIVPRVDYSQGVRDYLVQRTLGDIHVPTMDGIGMQDLLVDRFFSGALNWNSTKDGVEDVSIGRQPAWIELMTAVNETHGNFATYENLSYMVLNRPFNITSSGIANTNFSSYVDPLHYMGNFAGVDYASDPFWVQVRFKFFVKRALSKRVMPNL